jgi:hypothetical protein
MNRNYQGSIVEKTPPWGEYQRMSFGGKNLQRGRVKGENVKGKGRKGKKEKRGIKG